MSGCQVICSNLISGILSWPYCSGLLVPAFLSLLAFAQIFYCAYHLQQFIFRAFVQPPIVPVIKKIKIKILFITGNFVIGFFGPGIFVPSFCS